jgi:hypothetical protein
MTYIDVVPALLSLVFSVMAAIFMWRSAKAADALASQQSTIARLELNMKTLEYDFGEKWDNTMRKLTNRQAMRARRESEESEDLNKPNGGIIINGSTK